MSVRQESTIAVLMLYVITPGDPLTVRASLGTQELEVTVQVLLCC